MEITLNITEDSKVELVKDSCEAVQGEHNVTILNINFPSTIKGYPIDNYTKQIEFGECKELGECKKFFDVLNGNTYKLCSVCTQFEKLMIQFTLKNLVDEAEPIVWKSIPFALEFCESINAENTKEVQATLLSLAEIEAEWENYIKNNTFRVVSRVGDVSTADATSLGKTIFYLGANSTSPYALTYGHYYRCNYVNGAYEWTDLTQDPSLEGVANGIREINNNQTMQLWVGTLEELENEATQPNVLYIPENNGKTYTDVSFSPSVHVENSYSLDIDLSTYINSNMVLDDIIGVAVGLSIKKSSTDTFGDSLNGECLFFDKITITDSYIGDNGTRSRGKFVDYSTKYLTRVFIDLYENNTLKITVEPSTFDNLGTSFKPYQISCNSLRIFHR